MTTLDELVAAGLLAEEYPIGDLTTYRLGGLARYFLEAHNEAQLVTVGEAVDDELVLVLGRGSNLILSDEGYPGLVVRLGGGFVWTELDADGTARAGAGVSMPALARTCVKAGRGGLEFFVGIPGSVGGGVRMNAGCHGSDIREWLVAARIVDLRAGIVEERGPEDLQMSYRSTNLQPHQVVTAASFRTHPQAPADGEERMREITRWRRDHQPGGTLNAGSIFKNPPGDSAGRLIDHVGLKGMRVGGASVSAKHANFFVAEGEVRAQDIYDLVWAVRRRVGEETGVWLEPEVQFAGPFRPSPDEVTR